MSIDELTSMHLMNDLSKKQFEDITSTFNVSLEKTNKQKKMTKRLKISSVGSVKKIYIFNANVM